MPYSPPMAQSLAHQTFRRLLGWSTAREGVLLFRGTMKNRDHICSATNQAGSKGHIPFLLSMILWFLIYGCIKYPVVGSFEGYNEVFLGTVRGNLLTGTGTIEARGKRTNVPCAGTSEVTYIPDISYYLPICEGQRGIAVLTCDNETIVNANWTATSCTTGYGVGTDQEGRRFTFVFGMSEAEAMDFLKKQSEFASQHPKYYPNYNPKETRRERGFSTGTGFFVTNDGYMISSYHVIEDATEIVVVTHEGVQLKAEFILGNAVNDLALLKVNAMTKAIPIADSGHLSTGEEVFTLGYPLVIMQGQDQKATFGHIMSLTGVQGDIRFLQIDVPLQRGNSGGPLIDTRGQVVGVVTAALDQLVALRETGALPQDVNYAVKSDYVISLLRINPKNKWIQTPISTQRSNMAELVRRSNPSVGLVIAK